ncbi:hypothetical protein V2J09_013818 [Rumex salicifolius]
MDSTDAGASSPVVKPRQIYLIKPPHYEDPVELEFQIKEAQELLSEIKAARAPIIQELDFKKVDLVKFSWIYVYWPTPYQPDQAKYMLEFLQPCLAKLSFLDDCEEQIRNLKRQLIHNKIPRQAKEMKIFKELNDLIRTRDLYMADSSHAVENAKIIERWGSKDEIRQHIEEYEQSANSKLFVSRISFYDSRNRKRIQRKKASIEKEVRALERKLTYLNKKKASAHESILHLNRLQATIRAYSHTGVQMSDGVPVSEFFGNGVSDPSDTHIRVEVT